MFSKLSLFGFALAATAAPTANPDAGIYNIDISNRRSLEPRQATGEIDGAAFLTSLNSTLKKYNASPLRSFPGIDGNSGILRKRQSSEALTDQVETGGVDELYYGPVVVGSKSPQTFTADFDTGSADFFVPGPQCGAAQGCVQGTQYNQQGTDEHNTTSVTYGSGMITGENYFDTVSVAGLSASRTNVISLTSAQGFNNSDSNSLMGFAFSTIANSKQPTFFENLISQGKVSNHEFSFYLGRARSNTQSQSQLTLGGADASRYTGAFTSVPLTSRTYWQVQLQSASAGGRQAAGSGAAAAIDTGTTAIIAPMAAAASIHALIPGAFPVPLASGSPAETIYVFPCNVKPNVAFNFAGKSFAVNNLDMNLGSLTAGFADLLGNPNNLVGALTNALTGGGLCVSSIIGADIQGASGAPSLYVVGDSFLKNWYSTYNYDTSSVNFAAAKGNQ